MVSLLNPFVLLRLTIVLCWVGVPGIQPPEYPGSHRQHGCHCQAVGCAEWGGGGHTDCEMLSVPIAQYLSCCFSSHPFIINAMINFSLNSKSNYS